MSLFLVRHPQTSWNKQGRLQGRKEGKVTREGARQAQKFVQGSLKLNLAAICVAENNRTAYVGRLLKAVHPQAKLMVDPRLNERSFGTLEGLIDHEVGQKYDFDPDNYKKRFVWKPPQGESLKEIGKRVEAVIKDLRALDGQEDGDVMAVTSGGVIRVALYLLGERSLEETMAAKVGYLETVKVA